jgi:hypothetical protein
MPLSNAERQKRYVERQKLYNKDEYDKKISLKMKKYYKKVKNEDLTITTDTRDITDTSDDIAINSFTNNDESLQSIEYNEINNEDYNKNDNTNKDFECILLKPLKKRINPLNKSKLNDKSIQLYLKTIKKIYKNYYKKDLDDDTDLINVLTNKPYDLSKITLQLQFLKTDLFKVIKENYKDITILYAVITRIKNFAKQVKELYPYIEQKQNNYNEKRTNKKPDCVITHKIKVLSFKKEDILSILNDKELKLTDSEKLIFALMTLFPTRRPVDYIKMLISETKPKKETKIKINERNNYYYNKQFYFNVTKNKDIQQFDISDELDTLINEIIIARKTKTENKHLLLNNKLNEFSSSSLSIFIMKTFNKIYDISISAVEIRRLYSTYLKEEVKNGNITEEKHRNICEMMNHSYEENKKYAY